MVKTRNSRTLGRNWRKAKAKPSIHHNSLNQPYAPANHLSTEACSTIQPNTQSTGSCRHLLYNLFPMLPDNRELNALTIHRISAFSLLLTSKRYLDVLYRV